MGRGSDSTIKFYCDHCRKKLGVAPSLAGKTGKCPSCSRTIVVPPRSTRGQEGSGEAPQVATVSSTSPTAHSDPAAAVSPSSWLDPLGSVRAPSQAAAPDATNETNYGFRMGEEDKRRIDEEERYRAEARVRAELEAGRIPEATAPRPPEPARQRSRSPSRGAVVCSICNQGLLVSRRVFWMSGPVVMIGWILLIPSFLGMLFSALLLFASLGGAGAAIVEAGATPGVGLGGIAAGGSSLCMGVSSFVGGLFGWILVMKKRVLECQNCGAVVAAS